MNPTVVHRQRTPTVLQIEEVECGAAALGIILGYHGRLVPLEELRSACGVSRDGAKAGKIVKAARSYGLIAEGYRMPADQLATLPMPLIAFWNFSHFLVIEGMSKKGVFLNDPAGGPRLSTYEEFDRSYSGVALTFEPGPDFEQGGEKPNLIAALRRRLHGSQLALTFIVLASLALVGPGLVVPIFSQVFVDQYLVNGSKSILGPLLIGMAMTAVLRGALTWLQQHYLLRMQNKLSISMSGTFFWHVLRLPADFYSQRYAGEIGSRVSLNDRIAALLSGQLATTALNIVTVAFYVILMVNYDVVLTAVGVLFAALNIAALRYVSRRRIDVNQRVLQENGKLTGTSMGGLQSIETLKATGRESDFFTRWAGSQAKLVDAQQDIGRYDQVLNVLPTLLAGLNTAVILALGGLRVLEGDLTLGMLVAFQSLMASFTAPISQIVSLGSTLQETQGDLKRVDDVLQAQLDPGLADGSTAHPDPANPDSADPDSAGAAPMPAGRLELRGVTFGYNRLDPPLLTDLDLTLTPGSRVALIGSSGSGKSTVAKLVSGLYLPWDGDILLDGRPRLSIPRALRTSALSVVDQDIFLFEGSVRDNLTLWDPTIPEAQVIQAARDACIHDDVALRPGGYESTIDEGGANFSGGQRQRLEIARALVVNPALVVLDEATSALDPTTERRIDENLRRRGCTCLIVAHRLSTIRDCDEIIVLDRGSVVQRGTHQQMLDQDGPYARLIHAEAARLARTPVAR